MSSSSFAPRSARACWAETRRSTSRAKARQAEIGAPDGGSPFDGLGAVVTKTVTPASRPGNPMPRLVELPCGALNSIGLENVGYRRFLAEVLPEGGVVIDFNTDEFDPTALFQRIGEGSLGGKARGIAFLNKILVNEDIAHRLGGAGRDQLGVIAEHLLEHPMSEGRRACEFWEQVAPAVLRVTGEHDRCQRDCQQERGHDRDAAERQCHPVPT